MPYRYLFPSALFFIAVGVFSTQNSLFQIWEVLAFGVIGAVLMTLEFSVAPILLGFVLGPMVEENFRRALLPSRGDLMVFVQRPISAWFIGASALLILLQVWAFLRRGKAGRQARSRVRGLKRFEAVEDGPADCSAGPFDLCRACRMLALSPLLSAGRSFMHISSLVRSMILMPGCRACRLPCPVAAFPCGTRKARLPAPRPPWYGVRQPSCSRMNRASGRCSTWAPA